MGADGLDLAAFFDRVVVVSLDRRSDRWERLQGHLGAIDWPFRAPERVRAVDGRCCPAPTWWRAGPGAWGCFRSMLLVIEGALADGVERLLVLEDDVCFVPDLRPRARRFLAAVPDDWDQLYLGGEHLFAVRHPPIRVNAEVMRPFNVNRLHAVGLRRQFMQPLHRHLTNYAEHQLTPRRHVDHRVGMLHKTGRFNVYVPHAWLAGQTAGPSDVREVVLPLRYWHRPE